MVMLLLYITYKRFFLSLLALVVPRPELGDGRGGGVIYTRSFWSLFFLYISLCGLWKERDFGRRAKAGSSGLKLVKT